MKNIILVLSMMLITLVSTAQKIAIAIAPVLDVSIFNYETEIYELSGEGLVVNTYTSIVIKKIDNILVFKIFKADSLPLESTYRILEFSKGLIIAAKVNDGSGNLIKIVLMENAAEIHCGYNEETRRFDGVFLLGPLKFKKVKIAALKYL